MTQTDHVEDELEQLDANACELPALSVASFYEPIAQLLSKSALCVEAGAPVAAAIARMRNADFGAVCVVEHERLVGLLTERDLVCRVIDMSDYAQRPVSSVMLHSPLSLRSSDPILYVLHAMQAEGYRHIPIVDDAQRPVSVVSLKDVVRYILSHFPKTIHNVTAEPFRGPTTREGA